MANIYFNNIEQLENYREDAYVIDMTDIYRRSNILRNLLIPEIPGVYRFGKSVPVIREGDVLNVIKNNVSCEVMYYPSNAEAAVRDNVAIITFEELMKTNHEVRSADNSRQIIPPMSAKVRERHFTNKPVIPNNFLVALSAVITKIIEDLLGKNCLADYCVGLEKVLTIKLQDGAVLKEEALNYIYNKQYKEGKREPITEELINDVSESMKDEYEKILTLIENEIRAEIGIGLTNFLTERPCSRYHFDEDDVNFYIERGMDVRIYAYEYKRLSEVEETEADVTGLYVDKSRNRFSSTYDMF